MKEVTRYESEDGSTWKSRQDAWRRDSMIVDVAFVDKELPPVKDAYYQFANGGGYVQRKGETVRSVHKRLLAITETLIPDWFRDQREKFNTNFDDVDPSWFHRMLDGFSPPVESAWSRLYCIDKKFREWGQPYYALNPDKGKQVEWVEQ